MTSYANMARVAKRAAAVTPNDAADLPGGRAQGLYIGVAGNIKFNDGAGNVISATAVAAGFFPVEVTRVWATTTTATGILALYAS